MKFAVVPDMAHIVFSFTLIHGTFIYSYNDFQIETPVVISK